MNTAIMKSLLEEYLDEVGMTSDQLAEIELFIFHDNSEFRHVHSPEVFDTARYLKEIAEENEIKSSAELFNFFQHKKKKYNKFLWEVVDEVESNYNQLHMTLHVNDSSKADNTSLSIDTVIYPDLNSYNVHSYVKTLSRYFEHSFSSMRERILQHREITMHLDGTSHCQPVVCKQMIALGAKRKFARYFEEFSSKENNKEVVAWTEAAPQEYDITNCNFRGHNNEFDNLLVIHSHPDESHQWGIAKVYDNIVAHVAQEQPIDDETVKEELVEWLFYSKMHGAEAESLRSAIECFNDAKQFKPIVCVQKGKDLDQINLRKACYKSMLAQKQWKILKSPPGHTWLASDNPGFGINLGDLYNRPTEMVADGTLIDIRADTIIYYPISSEYCLRIQPFTGDKKRRKTTNLAAIEFEQSTIEELKVVNGLTFSTKKVMVVGRDRKFYEQLESI